MEHTRRLISQTAYHITDLHWKMEKELEGMEKKVCQGDVQSTLARYSGLVLNTAEMVIFKEIEGMEVKDLGGAMDIYAELMDAELMVTQPETELIKLIVEYRQMLRNINMEYIELIKVELQTKMFKQHKDKSRITPRIDPRDSDRTESQFREEQRDGAKKIEQI